MGFLRLAGDAAAAKEQQQQQQLEKEQGRRKCEYANIRRRTGRSGVEEAKMKKSKPVLPRKEQSIQQFILSLT